LPAGTGPACRAQSEAAGYDVCSGGKRSLNLVRAHRRIFEHPPGFYGQPDRDRSTANDLKESSITHREPLTHQLPQHKRADRVTGPPPSKAFRHDLWVSFIAASSVILMVGGGLLLLTAELRSGWVSEHEVKMDKAPAIHNLLFRP